MLSTLLMQKFSLNQFLIKKQTLVNKKQNILTDFIKNLDFFSQSIEFNSSKQNIRKRTFLGEFLTILIIVLSLLYFIYLIIQYSTGQIEPKFRSQTFVTNEDIDIPLDNNSIGIQIKQFNGDLTLEQIQKAQNKTYLTLLSFYEYKQGLSYKLINLDIIQCEDPQLKGYLCIDFKNLPEKKIPTGTQNNLYSLVQIAIYRCQEIDQFKTFVPDNCASPEEIDKYVQDLNNIIDIKIQTSQYNITSHQMQVNYKHQYQFMAFPKQVEFTELKIQKQVSSVKEGWFIQQESQYSSPISYIANQKIAEKNKKQLDNQYIKIQYETFPEILAQCNSAIALLMSLGFLGKFMAKKLIRQEIFILILKALYQETYQKILRLNGIQHFRDIYPEQIKFSQFKSDYVLEEGIDPILLPTLEVKSGEQILTQQDSQINRQIEDTKSQSVLYLKKKGSTDKKYLEIETDKSQIQLETRKEKSRSNLNLFKQVIKDGQLNSTFSSIQQNNTNESQTVSQNRDKKYTIKQKQQNIIQMDNFKKESRRTFQKSS